MTRPRVPGSVLRGLAVAALAAACALWTLYPAWLDGTHVLVGDWRHPDTLSNHWLYEWVAERVSSGASILHNDRYYWPVGDAPWLAGNAGDAPLYALVRVLVPWPGALTLWLALGIGLNGVATFALCRRTGAGTLGSLYGAAVVGLSAYVAHELTGARFSQAPLYPLIGFLWAWLGLLQRPSPARAAGAGVLFALTGAFYWYYAFWAVLAGAILLLGPALQGGRDLRARFQPLARPLGVFASVALALTLPLLLLFLGNWGGIPGTDDSRFPHPLALASSLPVTFPLNGATIERGEVVVPVLALGLAVVGFRRRPWREVLPWAVLGLVFWTLALGPHLLLPDGTDTGIPGPFALVYGGAGILRRFWWPYRHVVGVLVGVAVLAAHGVDWLADVLRARFGRRGALAVAVLLPALPLDTALLGGRTAPGLTWWEPPVGYEALAELPGDVILELPLAPEVTSSQQTLLYQKVHGKTLVNGHAMWVDRVRPQAWDAWVEGNSFLRTLQEYERGRLFAPFAFKPEDVLALRAAGFRYLVVNAEYYPQALYGLVDRYEALFLPVFGPPAFDFRGHLRAWDLEAYTWAGFVEAPEFRLPADYLDRDGSAMLDLGHNRSMGFRGLARTFPPELPPREAPLEGPVEQAP